MSNYNTLKTTINANIKQNGNQEITGQILNSVLNQMVTTLGAGYQFAGVATTATNPGTPDAKVFYIANGKGTYTNFSGLEVAEDEVVVLKYDTEWHKVSTGIASNKKLTELKEKVDALALGAFYGYFPDSVSLPTDVTTPGYAYVGTDNPYEIWNFNGESWSDSGTSIDQNDADEEDITRNADGKLQFKDRSYGDGMGYVILRKDKTFAAQVTQANTIYEVRYDFDLDGDEILLPNGSILKFNGGKIKNGNITFVNTTIDAPSTEIVFENVEISGSLIGSNRYAHWFEYSTTGHDDWNLIKTLFTQPGNVYLDSKTYNVDKLLHTSQNIFLCDDLNVYGCNGCALNANYTGASGYDSIFDITGKSNITIKDIAINCVIGTTMSPPAGHGSTRYSSSGIYAFILNDYCSNLRFSNIQFNNVGYAIKSTSHSAYTGMVYFENITIDNCYFLCDMPIQGTGYANVIIRNCKILSRGTNSGNHAIYMLPIKDAEYTKNSSMYFEKCYIYSPDPDGQVVQIYTAGDSALTESTKTYFNDCEIVSTGAGLIVSSESATIIMNNCVLKSTAEAKINPTGNIIAYNCNFYFCLLYKNFEAYKCNFETTTLIIGDTSVTTSNTPVVLDGCNIKASQYLIYNNVDAGVPIIRNCNIEVTGDGVISQRQSQIEPVEFVNCKIKVNSRLAYCPNKVNENIISFINCALTSNNPSYAFITNSPNAKLNIVNCSFNGDTINMPTSPRNSGTTRPSNGVGVGQAFFDTNLGKPIFWTGTKWVDATGADV